MRNIYQRIQQSLLRLPLLWIGITLGLALIAGPYLQTHLDFVEITYARLEVKEWVIEDLDHGNFCLKAFYPPALRSGNLDLITSPIKIQLQALTLQVSSMPTQTSGPCTTSSLANIRNTGSITYFVYLNIEPVVTFENKDGQPMIFPIEFTPGFHSNTNEFYVRPGDPFRSNPIDTINLSFDNFIGQKRNRVRLLV